MKIRLGYACIPVTINETASHSITYTNYKRLSDRANQRLKEVINSNFQSLENILMYNIKNDISFFRMTSNLIPLVNLNDVNYNVFGNHINDFKNIGEIINSNNLRVDIHLSPFYVLNSINNDVVTSTINILNFYFKMYSYMNIDSKIILHVGSSAQGKKESIKRFINNFNLLDKNIKKLIILENDDKIFNIRNVLKICETINIPMVLDYHHFKVNRNNERIEDYITRIFNTWKDIPKVHFSSAKDKRNKKSHNDYIDVDEFIEFIEKVRFTNIDFDVMIEAKKKDEALFKLIRELKYKTDYKIEKTTIIL